MKFGSQISSVYHSKSTSELLRGPLATMSLIPYSHPLRGTYYKFFRNSANYLATNIVRMLAWLDLILSYGMDLLTSPTPPSTKFPYATEFVLYATGLAILGVQSRKPDLLCLVITHPGFELGSLPHSES